MLFNIAIQQTMPKQSQIEEQPVRNVDQDVDPNIYKSRRCEAHKKTGGRCKLRTLKSQYCWIHLQQIDNLRVKKSHIPNANNGLFTGKLPLKKNFRIAEYTGDTYTTPVDGDYVLRVNSRKYVDARNPKNIGGFLNDCRTSNKRANQCNGNNAEFYSDSNTGRAYIRTKKRVKANEELFAAYGREYRLPSATSY